MEKNSTTDLKELIRHIDNDVIILPDFQREFVWKDEEQQRKIVASVLAKMPIGSILLLKSKPSEYSAKQIGCKFELNADDDSEVEFLLDGQQRITVLTNVFSSVIHQKCTKVSDLISPSLKRRFFLRIPKWSKCNEEKDLFGVRNLDFTIKNPDNEDPTFLSSEILDYVECISFLNGDNKPYNPQVALSTDLDDFCLTYDKGYLIPLFLMAPGEDKKSQQVILRINTIISKISSKLSDEIKDYVVTLETEERRNFINEMFDNDDVLNNYIIEQNDFESMLEDKVELWKSYIDEYLKSCIKHVSLNRIIVSEEQRERAIDIYENLNRGGISLNTFDLVMARVAKVSKDNFYQRLIGNILNTKYYDNSLLPECIIKIAGNMIENNEYNASLTIGCYNSDKNEIDGKYIDAFLDVLSLYCNNRDFEPSGFSIEHTKRKEILSLKPMDIHDNCELVCNAIDRALFFFQTRCGIRNIKEINYQLMLVLVATVFTKDEFFFNRGVHDILEAWYWASLFTGEYDKDQNRRMIENLKSIVSTILGESSTEWLHLLQNKVLIAEDFSDEKFLLYEKVNENRYPKKALRCFMYQYLLSKTYRDMFHPEKQLSVFDPEAKSYEAHHIIPLGTVKKIGQTTSELRNNEKHICNSPLNFVLITSNSNLEISDKPIRDYINLITDEAKAALYINHFDKEVYDDEYVRSILRSRYNSLKGDIKSHISDLLCLAE